MFNGFHPTKSLLAICVFLKQKKLEPSVLAEQFDIYDPSMYVSVMICTVEPVCYGGLFSYQLCFKSHKSIPIALYQRRATSTRSPNSFIFMQFWVQNLQNNRLAYPLSQLAAPIKSCIRHRTGHTYQSC